MNWNNPSKGDLVLAGVVVASIVLWPLVAILTVNYLFHVGIPYTPGTWAAMLFLGAFLRGNTTTEKGRGGFRNKGGIL